MKYLRRVSEMTDFDEYFDIKSDPNAILWSGFATAPDKEKLKLHFQKLITNENVYLFFLVDRETNEVVGYDQMVKINENTVESAGHSIKTQYARQGFGNLLLRLVVAKAKELQFKSIIGWISENNIGSIRNFINSGFVRTDEPYRMVRLEALGREDRFFMYERTV